MTVEWFLAGLLVGAVGVWLQQHDPESSDAVDEYLEQREADLRDRYETTAMDYVEFGDRVAVPEAPGTERIMRDGAADNLITPSTSMFNIGKTSHDSFRDVHHPISSPKCPATEADA